MDIVYKYNQLLRTAYSGLGMVFIIFSLLSCKDDFTNNKTQVGNVIVDGYIEAGRPAVVHLSYTLPMDAQIDSSQYLRIINISADVKISDGTTTEYMITTWNQKYFPQHYYQSLTIKGVPGKTYYLEVIFKGDTLRAQTIIPETPQFDSVWFEKTQTDSLRNLWFSMCDDGEKQRYYKMFSLVKGKDLDYVPSKYSSFTNDLFKGGCVDKTMQKGLENMLDLTVDNYFILGDTVSFKLASIGAVEYKYWQSYDKEINNRGNPFVNVNKNVLSNISNGIGIWCGYNSVVKTVIVK